MQIVSRRRHDRAALLVALAAAVACTDHGAPTAAEQEPGGDAGALAALACTVDVRAGSMACDAARAAAAPNASASRSADGGPRLDLTVGGQNSYIRLATAGPQTRDDATALVSGPVTVTNLMGQPLGTPDGSTVSGVRVFFHQLPTVTQGTGTVEVANPDGAGVFTGASQPYHLYNQALQPGETSAPKTWQFRVPATVQQFVFQVYVRAALPREQASGGNLPRLARVAEVAPTTNGLTAIWGSSSSDIWVVGGNGTILHNTTGGDIYVPVASGTTATLVDVWGSAANNIYAVGNSNTFPATPVILRYNGTTWQSEAVPAGVSRLTAVTGVGNAVYATGGTTSNEPLVLTRSSSGVWTPMTMPVSVGFLVDISAAAPDRVYAVGSSNAAVLLLWWNGSTWTRITAPSSVTTQPTNISGTPTSVFADRNGYVHIAGGYPPYVLHYYVAGTWFRDDPPLFPLAGSVSGLAGSPSGELVAVGGGAVWRWQGFGSWRVENQYTQRMLYNAWFAPDGSMRAVGSSGTIMGDNARRILYPVTLRGASGATAVGDEGNVLTVTTTSGVVSWTNTACYYAPPGFGTQLFNLQAVGAGVYADASTPVRALPSGSTNGTCEPVSTSGAGSWYAATRNLVGGTTGVVSVPASPGPATTELASTTVYGMATIGGDDFAVGTSVYRRRASTGAWGPMSPSPGNGAPLRGVWGSSLSDIFAVGDGGAIYHYNGTSWVTMGSGTTTRLNAVWGAGPGDVYAAGEGGTVLYYDGIRWTVLPSGTTDPLYAVGGRSAGEVYVFGLNGTVLRASR